MGQLCSTAPNADFLTLADLKRALSASGVLDDLELVVGVDASKSNEILGANAFGGRSLHDVGDDAPENPYIGVMRAATKLFAAGAESALPLYYFGSEQAAQAPGGLVYVKECRGQQDLVQTYRASIGSQTLSGQTSFVPLIREACRRVRESRKYHILLIITDGAVLDEPEHFACLNEASTCALSIVCAGVGDGPFDAMERFDDQIPKERVFDNFQFVPFNHKTYPSKYFSPTHAGSGSRHDLKVATLGAASASDERTAREDDFFFHAFMEVPRQYRAICEKLGYRAALHAHTPARLSVSVSATTSKPLYASAFPDFDTKTPLLAAPHPGAAAATAGTVGHYHQRHSQSHSAAAAAPPAAGTAEAEAAAAGQSASPGAAPTALSGSVSAGVPEIAVAVAGAPAAADGALL